VGDQNYTDIAVVRIINVGISTMAKTGGLPGDFETYIWAGQRWNLMDAMFFSSKAHWLGAI
jgi:hypothetical protein